jgi:signal transduction histidine kinase
VIAMMRPEGEGRPRRRRARPVPLDQRLERALANAGLANVGQQVGRVVGEALSRATHEIDRSLERAGRRHRRRGEGRAGEEAKPGRRAENLSLLWGLLEIRRDESGEERVSVLWGLLDVRTRGPARAEPGEEALGREDRVQLALRRAERRVESLRSASIFGCLGLGFGYIAAVSPAPFWNGVWAVTSVSLLALAAGLLVAARAERLRRRYVDEELGRADAAVGRTAPDHARAMQELTASIAHEIRNPITAAKSLVQQMGEDPASGENVEYARVALEELERVERSVSHLLRFARDEEVVFEELRMAEVVREAVQGLEERAGRLGVELRAEADAEGRLRGDAEKLRRVIVNLVGNALDALEGAATAQPRVLVQTGESLAGTEVWVRVRDNGPGIAAEEQARVFGPFHTTKAGGTGLGLAIARKIVEAHGGTIELSSTPGRGAEFVLTFPKAQPSS